MSTERAEVRVMPGGREPEPVTPVSDEPEAQPPVTTAPPQERTPDLGGSALSAPSPEDIVGAAGGAIADRMRARFQSIAATEEFPVPGWELPDGRPGLIIEARAYGDRKAFGDGVSNELFIAKSTHRLFFVNDDGSREVIEGGFGPKLAEIIGVKVAKAADLVALVISKPDPDNPDQRIPNVAGIGTLATEMVAWAGRGARTAEETLGE